MKFISLNDIDIKAGDNFLFNIEKLSINTGDKIGIIGANGSGKTSFISFIDNYVHKRGIWHFQYQNKQEELIGSSKEKSIWGVNKLYHDFKDFSGGEKMRAYLSYVFSHDADIYVFDEPTTNLDIESVKIFIETILQKDSYLIISHDRNLLNTVCNRIISVKDNKIYDYKGNYDEYLEWEESENNRKWSEYKNYISEKERLEKALENKKIQAVRSQRKPKNKSASEIRQITYGSVGKSIGGKVKSLNSQAKNIEKRIEKLDKKEKPKSEVKIKLQFDLTDPPENKVLIQSENLNFSYNDKEIFKDAAFSLYKDEKIALLGKNGSGKTTLLNLINSGYKDIYKVPKLKIGYLRQNLNNLDFDKTVIENIGYSSIQSEIINRVTLDRLGFSKNDIKKKTGVLSSGERVKLYLAVLSVSDINFLILDEPTNYLDINSVKAVEEFLKDYEGGILFVSHDDRFVRNLSTGVWTIENCKIKTFSEY